MQTATRKSRRLKARGARSPIGGRRRRAALRRSTAPAKPHTKGRSGRLRGMQEEDFAIPPSLTRPKVVFLNCHYCGYAPQEMPKDQTCPKCGGHSWERFYLSAKLVPRNQG